MSQPKFAPSPASGHGLVDRITDAHFSAYSKTEPIEVLPALVLLKVVGGGGHDTANGRVNTVKYEVIRCEPFTDPGDRDDAIWRVQDLYQNRTSNGTQQTLPLGAAGLSREERRVALLERLEDWAEDNDVAGAELEGKWREHFGIGDGQEFSYGDRGVPGDYRKSEVAWLMEFAITVGALSNDEGSADLVEGAIEDSDDDGTGDGDEPEADGE